MGRRSLFLVGCWPEAALCSLPHDLSIRVNTGDGTQQGEEYQQDEKMKVMVSCNLIMEGTFHHFRCILFVRNKSLDPAHNWAGITLRVQILGVGDDFEPCQILPGTYSTSMPVIFMNRK